MKSAKIIIEPQKKTSERWAKALRGKLKNAGNSEVISFSSWETLARVLSGPRLQILAAIPAIMPNSIAGLARALRRDFKNVHSDVQFLASLGLIELRESSPRKTLIPRPKFKGIEISWEETPATDLKKSTA